MSWPAPSTPRTGCCRRCSTDDRSRQRPAPDRPGRPRPSHGQRFAGAYHGAEQVAAAVVAAAPAASGVAPGCGPARRRGPELAEWAGFFSSLAPLAAAARDGAAVSERTSADLVRDAQRFLGDAARWLRRRERVVAEAG
ncbi:hypothetical protein G7085_03050 [Tessaracoccus sp. HDW20]|uniref:SAV_6107 family HEPN domain-containing protein n=1 Tax=Tessaracoccus coleopterorum TaxID=2714950 RepID=UPI0018D3337C|nr:SAV_6107 family HEPN domain-containing protein [Tessaracoccus coleopterorum]NHB83985.1 hypothetical protein [Tessaracoccus coleopterorum]